MFDLNLGLFVWTSLVFLVLLGILWKFAWGPILAAVDAREKGIQGALDQAASEREAAAKLLAQHREQLADARRQAQEIVASARDAGERLRTEIEAKAREEGDRMLERARGEIGRERDQAIEMLRRESVELALSAASRLLHRRLDSEADRKLVEDYLKQLDRPAAEA
ncbi:MAG: ATP synthase F0 subunit B [Gemmatimonadetes bacterium]|nr:ATP synthase F0 subunit B [Gemmatimonadota bacterium]